MATKAISPTLTQIFYNLSGSIVDIKGETKINRLSNDTNLIEIFTETEYIEKSIPLLNFTPTNSTVQYTTHWLYVKPSGYESHITKGEVLPKQYYKYSMYVPSQVFNNITKNINSFTENTLTFIIKYSQQSLGGYATFNDLETVNPPTSDINGYFAYVYADTNDLNGYWQVEYNSEEEVFKWEFKGQSVETYIQVKQFETTTLLIKKGFENPQQFPTISQTTIEIFMQQLADLQNTVENIDLTEYLRLDGSYAMQGNLNMNDYNINNVAPATELKQAINLQQLNEKFDDLGDTYLKTDGSNKMIGVLNLRDAVPDSSRTLMISRHENSRLEIKSSGTDGFSFEHQGTGEFFAFSINPRLFQYITISKAFTISETGFSLDDRSIYGVKENTALDSAVNLQQLNDKTTMTITEVVW